MQIYLVGGAVRDTLMGIRPKDRDYVVVGARPADLLSQGYRQVGKDFPVFLHPQTGYEYALARTERKSGAGHKGFLVSTENVTLEEDLSRRDLTLNSMALDEAGKLYDPYGGAKDLANRTLRHTTLAFAEDPLRILRVARFLARFGAAWRVADETRELMHTMLEEGALDELPFERIWKELERGLMEPFPGEMLAFMHSMGMFYRCKRLAFLLAQHPDASFRVAAAAELELPLTVRFATVFQCNGPEESIPSALPKEVLDAARTVSWSLDNGLATFNALPAAQQLHLLDRLDPLRRPARFVDLLAAAQLVHPFQPDAIDRAVSALRSLNMQALAAQGGSGMDIRNRIHAAKLQVLEEKAQLT